VAANPFQTTLVSPWFVLSACGRRWMRASPTRVPTASETSSWRADSWCGPFSSGMMPTVSRPMMEITAMEEKLASQVVLERSDIEPNFILNVSADFS